MGILKCEINMEDISTKEIFDIIVDGFDELSVRLNDENVSNKKKRIFEEKRPKNSKELTSNQEANKKPTK